MIRTSKDAVIWAVTLLVVALSLSLARATASLAGTRRVTFPQYPSASDLVVPTLCCLSSLATLRLLLCRYVLRPLAIKVIVSKGKTTVDRFVSCSFKAVWFSMWAPTLWLCFRGEPWFPMALGGAGTDSRTMWSGWPSTPVPPLGTAAYSLELSYHLLSFGLHIVSAIPPSSRRADYAEMTLHHVCAVSLVALSYAHNLQRVGIVVMFVHAYTDVLAYATKVIFELGRPRANIISYFLMATSFFYGRLLVYPIWVVRSALVDSIEGLQPSERHGYVAFNCMLVALLVLHVYWFVMIARIGLDHLRGVKYRDVPHLVGMNPSSQQQQ